MPLFTLLVMNIHRNTLAGPKGLTALLGTKVLTYLGAISFPIFVLHGAIGQARGAGAAAGALHACMRRTST